MSGRVSRFPGVGCRYFMRGRCFRAEALNPGLEQSWRCEILRSWEEAYDAFVTQADVFRLTLEQASDIWEKRLDRLILAHPRCEAYTPRNEVDSTAEDSEDSAGSTDDDGPEPSPVEADDSHRAAAEQESEMVGCAHCWQGYCLAALPPCTGVCEEFLRPDAQ